MQSLMKKNQETSLGRERKFALLKRLFPIALALVLIGLIFYTFQMYRRSTQALALQHNLQHLRLIETVAVSLENRLLNMQAAYDHFASVIQNAPHFESSAANVTREIEASFPTIVSRAMMLGPSDIGSSVANPNSVESQLALHPISADELREAVTKPKSQLLFLRSSRGESLLVFLSPLHKQTGHLAVLVPFERLLETYHLNDVSYDEDYVWILSRDGTLLYHRHHPEMIGRNIFRPDSDCLTCHRSFDLEAKMAQGSLGHGINEVPAGAKKIVAYAPISLGEQKWIIAVSESFQTTTALVQRNMRDFTWITILLSLIIFMSAVYVTRANYLRHEVEQEAFHLREERHLQQQLESKHQQWMEAERFATVGRMAAQVAHEIKNPLSSISLNTELLMDELKARNAQPSSEATQLTHSILSEIDLLTKTIDEYLQFARFPKLQREEISLPEIFDGLRQLLKEESFSRSIALHLSASSFVPKFSADPRLLRQALLNLIRNSFDAIEDHGWIRMEAALQNGDILIEVSDNGPGIAPENLPMLFEPFFTTKPKGTGLGLPLTHHIVLEHGGQITYEPSPDGGAKFIITLPIKPEKTATQPEPS